ncbi:hypothetical protein BC827DRAFT_1174875 [Russula dissimulans]|nr:hypothetical protein BC827DRAFT_1174875 [Russula dissimulans]
MGLFTSRFPRLLSPRSLMITSTRHLSRISAQHDLSHHLHRFHFVRSCSQPHCRGTHAHPSAGH